MGSVRKDADDMQLVIADARKTVQAATQVFREAKEGKGLLPALLTNQELANDLRALISNLRAHGVLFYRDNAAKSRHALPVNKRRNAAPGWGTLMTPLLTVNLLRVLFVTFCGAIGASVSAELTGKLLGRACPWRGGWAWWSC